MNVKIGFDDSVADTDYDIMFNETEQTLMVHGIVYALETLRVLGDPKSVGKAFRIESNDEGVLVLVQA